MAASPLSTGALSWSAAAHVRQLASRTSTGHLAWYCSHIEKHREEQLQHLGDVAYLDYAGAALYSQTQLQAASRVLLEGLLANPHTSAASAAMIADARMEMLRMFNVSPATHSLVFTSGATHALQLVGESFAWSREGLFVYAQESHTSALGLRQLARRAGVTCGTCALDALMQLCSKGLSAASLLLLDEEDGVRGPMVDRDHPGRGQMGPNLLLLPGESNFSGERFDLDLINQLRASKMGWRVFLDAAKLASSPGALDLSSCNADFTAISFYKIFGYPTGLGALIVRHDAVPLLAPRGSSDGEGGPRDAFGPAYFAGGNVAAVSATSGFAVPRPDLVEWLERGTSHFLGIAALPSQLAAVRALGPDALRSRHALAVCREAYLRTSGLIHNSGWPLCTVFGRHGEPRWDEVQGPVIALVLHWRDGSHVPYGTVLEHAKSRNIILRAGCHCNAGSCQKFLGLTDGDLRNFFLAGKVCGDDMGIVDGRATGALRISFGLYSTLADVDRWIKLLRDKFLNQLPENAAVDDMVCALRTPASREYTVHPTPSLPPASEPAEALAAPAAALAPCEPQQQQQQQQQRLPPVVEVAPPQRSAGNAVVGLKVYPIKGCGPLVVRSWPMCPTTGALFLDRRWCLAVKPPPGREAARVKTVSAKQAPRLTQVRLALRFLSGKPVLVLFARHPHVRPLVLPLTEEDGAVLRRSNASAQDEDEQLQSPEALQEGVENLDPLEQAARWFESLLEVPQLQLLESGAMPGTGEAPAGHAHFANAPSTLLLVSRASLQEFGRLCGLAVPANRFRANIEVDYEPAFAEADWQVGSTIRVGGVEFEAAGRCVRCQAVDIDPEDGASVGPSLLAALATTRPGGGSGPTFGVLLRHCSGSDGVGPKPTVISVGMPVVAEDAASYASGGSKLDSGAAVAR